MLKDDENPQVDEVDEVGHFSKSLFHEEKLAKKSQKPASLSTFEASEVDEISTDPNNSEVELDNNNELPDCPDCGEWDWIFDEEGRPVCNNCGKILEQ